MANNTILPIPQEPVGESHRWREWFKSVENTIRALQGSTISATDVKDLDKYIEDYLKKNTTK